MRWRTKGQIAFDTVARRTAFVNGYTAWKVGKPLLLEGNRLVDEEGGDPEAIPPIPPTPVIKVYFDVVFVTDATTRELRDWLVGLPRTGITRVFICLHRCGLNDPNPEAVVTNEYLEWP